MEIRTSYRALPDESGAVVQVMVQRKISWNRVYYSFDGGQSFEFSKRKAYECALANGQLAVRGKTVKRLDGSTFTVT